MRIAYLILAHNNPAHLARLIGRLRAPGAAFYVHIDANAPMAPFAALAAPSVTLLSNRVACSWGDISLVKATLALMAAASAGGEYDYCVLLSGADYPLQTADYIARFLAAHKGTEFIEVFALPNAEYGKSIERISRWWIRKGRPLARFRWPLQHWLNRHLPPRDYRKALGGGEAVTGSQWWCLTGAAVRYVLEQTQRSPRLYRFCKFVDCSDEFFFQVTLWNSPFRARISHSLTYTDWQPGKMSPETIDAGYLPQFAGPVIRDSARNNCPNEKREVLFARKFSDASGALLDDLDRLAARRAGAPADVA